MKLNLTLLKSAQFFFAKIKISRISANITLIPLRNEFKIAVKVD